MKTKRQSKILEIIKENKVDTQDKLARLLFEAGYEVTQATISRDIKELKLSKITDEGSSRQYYSAVGVDNVKVSERLKRVFKDGVVSIDYAEHIIVIKTLNGMAMAVAAALDSMENNEIMGTIAGDDTIFCVVKAEQKAIKLIERLKSTM